VPEFQAPKVAM